MKKKKKENESGDTRKDWSVELTNFKGQVRLYQ